MRGEFKHLETKKTFFYITTDSTLFEGYNQVIELKETDTQRYATVKKTVAYVVVDENPDGSPVVEKWPIKLLWRRDNDGNLL